MKRVTVLYGIDESSEKEVSIKGSKYANEALNRLGYKVKMLEFSDRFIYDIADDKPDVVFNMTHGKIGEDGTIQAVLNLLKIPYTHSGHLASTIAMDKTMSLCMF